MFGITFRKKTVCPMCMAGNKVDDLNKLKFCKTHARNHVMFLCREPSGREYMMIALDPRVK